MSNVPEPRSDDSSQVALALEVAQTQARRGNLAATAEWIQKAAAAAFEGGHDDRGVQLSKAAAEFTTAATGQAPRRKGSADATGRHSALRVSATNDKRAGTAAPVPTPPPARPAMSGKAPLPIAHKAQVAMPVAPPRSSSPASPVAASKMTAPSRDAPSEPKATASIPPPTPRNTPAVPKATASIPPPTPRPAPSTPRAPASIPPPTPPAAKAAATATAKATPAAPTPPVAMKAPAAPPPSPKPVVPAERPEPSVSVPFPLVQRAATPGGPERSGAPEPRKAASGSTKKATRQPRPGDAGATVKAPAQRPSAEATAKFGAVPADGAAAVLAQAAAGATPPRSADPPLPLAAAAVSDGDADDASEKATLIHTRTTMLSGYPRTAVDAAHTLIVAPAGQAVWVAVRQTDEGYTARPIGEETPAPGELEALLVFIARLPG